MGLDEGQGYFFARPMELPSFEQWLDCQKGARAVANIAFSDILQIIGILALPGGLRRCSMTLSENLCFPEDSAGSRALKSGQAYL